MIPVSALTLNQAHRRYDVSRSTLHRRLQNGAIPGAYFDEDEATWVIPFGAMEQAGYEPRPPKNGAEADLARLREKVEEQDRTIAAQQKTIDTLEATVTDLRLTIQYERRALGPGTAPPSDEAVIVEEKHSEPVEEPSPEPVEAVPVEEPSPEPVEAVAAEVPASGDEVPAEASQLGWWRRMFQRSAAQ